VAEHSKAWANIGQFLPQDKGWSTTARDANIWVAAPDLPKRRIAAHLGIMETVGDFEYHMQLALAARRRAATSENSDIARRHREVAVKHKRRARQLQRLSGRRN